LVGLVSDIRNKKRSAFSASSVFLYKICVRPEDDQTGNVVRQLLIESTDNGVVEQAGLKDDKKYDSDKEEEENTSKKNKNAESETTESEEESSPSSKKSNTGSPNNEKEDLEAGVQEEANTAEEKKEEEATDAHSNDKDETSPSPKRKRTRSKLPAAPKSTGSQSKMTRSGKKKKDSSPLHEGMSP
jgi:flagellar biosynthesis GTPase FlhF